MSSSKFNAAFWKWFGDSKVVDSKGKPLVVYHGTGPSGWEFKNGKVIIKNDEFLEFKTPSYFTDNEDYAEGFAQMQANERALGNYPRIIPVYLSILEPFDARGDTEYWKILRKNTASEVANLKSHGFDGILLEEVERGHKMHSDIWVAFYPSQIKSAIGNDGSWDSDDPDIRSNPNNDLLKKGDVRWFEYHCTESHCSSHAEWWYRSHQKVTVLKCNNKEYSKYPQKERYKQAILLGYDVLFKDGFVGEAMEDELLKSKADFERPDPPKPRHDIRDFHKK